MNLQEAAEKFKQQWDRFFQTAQKPSSCIFCRYPEVYWNGQRQRSASVLIADDVVYLPDIRCKRVKCASPECKRSWTLRPPGLMPRRHYQLCVVAHGAKQFLFTAHATLTSVAHQHQCSRQTVRRWSNWIAHIAQPSDLIGRLFSLSRQTALASGLKLSELITKTSKKLFQRTAINFCILQALGTAYGYEPPGFRAMIETAIANRDRISTYRCPFIPELAR